MRYSKVPSFQVGHTEVAPASEFWLAESYHQDYYKENPCATATTALPCGRDARLEKI